MLVVYLLLEMQALSGYILACFKKNSAFSTEAGLKYFISGSFFSGVFLFGCSLIYGALGTLNLNSIVLILIAPVNNLLLHNFILVGCLCVLFTLFFKLAVFPFHFWSPDVYEGAPLASTIVFSILPKIALFHFLIKFVCIITPIFPEISYLLFICGVLTALYGFFLAISQKRMKRLIIYSSMTQTGLLIAVISTPTLYTLTALYFFIIIYIITSVLIWSFVALLYGAKEIISGFLLKTPSPLYISDVINLSKTNIMWSFTILILLFSIAGIPPLSGFLAKFFLFFGLIHSAQIVGAIVLIFISGASVIYYIRLIKLAYFEYIDSKLKNDYAQSVFTKYYSGLDYLAFSGLLFLLFIIFYFPSFLLLICQHIVLASRFF